MGLYDYNFYDNTLRQDIVTALSVEYYKHPDIYQVRFL